MLPPLLRRFFLACLLFPALPATAALASSPVPGAQSVLQELGSELGAKFLIKPADEPRVVEGLRDALQGKPPRLEQREGPPLELDFQAETYRANRADARAYLAKAAKQKGAQALPSGAVLIPLKEGSGPSPSASAVVKVSYTIALSDGAPFARAHGRNTGNPVELSLAEQVPCWREALPKVKAGGRLLLVCPAEQAYGPEGRFPPTRPAQAVEFEIDLLEVVSQQPAAPVAQRSSSVAQGQTSVTGEPSRRDIELYLLGYSVGADLAIEPEEVPAVAQGLREGTREEAHPSEIFSPALRQFLRARRAERARRNEAVGAAYAERFARRPGVIRSPSGMLLKTIKEGHGKAPGMEDDVWFNTQGGPVGPRPPEAWPREYHPMKRRSPELACIREALGAMKPGGVAEVVCPASLVSTYWQTAAMAEEETPLRLLNPGGRYHHYRIELLTGPL